MEAKKYRILVVPIEEEEDAFFIYYASSDQNADLIGCGLAFVEGHSGAETWSRVQVWDDKRGEWIDGDSGLRMDRRIEPASWKEARAVAPEMFESDPDEQATLFSEEQGA